jgi:hypothetical protein
MAVERKIQFNEPKENNVPLRLLCLTAEFSTLSSTMERLLNFIEYLLSDVDDLTHLKSINYPVLQTGAISLSFPVPVWGFSFRRTK